MSENVIEITALGKYYNLYAKPTDRVLDVFGMLKFMPWKKKTVQQFWALRDINLLVRKGERLGLVGRNGAGKSTLLKLVCGNINPNEGNIQVNGKIQALMELGTAFHPEFSGRQNIRASLAYQGLSGQRIKECEEEIEDFVELGIFLDQPVKTYSAGMYARLAFATATSIEPDIIIVDEVLGAGDAYFASKCAERMRRLTHDSGATMLFVSHDLASVQLMCDRAVWVEHGRIIMDDSPLDVTKAYYAKILEQEEERLKARNAMVLANLSSVDNKLTTETKLKSMLSQNEHSYDLDNECGDERPESLKSPLHDPMDNKQPSERNKMVVDKWDTPHASFLSVNMINKSGNVSYVYQLNESFHLAVLVRAQHDLPPCYLCVVIYDNLGNRVGIWVEQVDKLTKGDTTLTMFCKEPRLRQGEYITSLELLPDYDPLATEKLPFYCHWNRCIQFKIDEHYLGNIPLGLIELPFELEKFDSGLEVN